MGVMLHVRRTTVTPQWAQRPAEVTPYCEQCRVAWPCPSAAAIEAAAQTASERE